MPAPTPVLHFRRAGRAQGRSRGVLSELLLSAFFLLFRWVRLALYARSAALHNALHFIERGHRSVARSSHRQRAVSTSAVDGPLRALLVEEAVDQAGSKRVAAADTVEDLEVGHWTRLVERTLVVAHRAPVVDARRLRMAQRGSDRPEVGKRLHSLLDHLAEVGRVEFAQVIADALDLESQRSSEVLFVANHDIDVRRQLAIDFGGARLPANRLPQRVAVVQVVADHGAVLARRHHRLLAHLGRRLTQRAEYSARMQPARAFPAKDLVPVDLC